MAKNEFTRKTRFFIYIFLMLFSVGVLFLMGKELKAFSQGMAYAQWEPLPAAIENDENAIVYAYTWEGKAHQGIYAVKSPVEKNRRAFLDSGVENLFCRVNPANPNQSVLFWSPSPIEAFYPILAMMLFSMLPFIAFCGMCKKGNPAGWSIGWAILHLCYAAAFYGVLARMPADAWALALQPWRGMVFVPALMLLTGFMIFFFSSQPNRERIKRGLTLLIPLAPLIPGFYLAWLWHAPIAHVEQRLDWVEVPAQLSDWKMEREYSSNGRHGLSVTGIHLAKDYRYTFNGKQYAGNSIDGNSFAHDNADYRLAIASRLKSGEVTTCRVNPENPREAVLFNAFAPVAERGVYVFFSYFAVTAGIWMFVALYTVRRNEAQMKAAGFVRINPAPGFLTLAIALILEGLFFGWLLMRLYALPPEALYGDVLTWWLNLLPVPGALGAAWYGVKTWLVWPRRRVVLSRAEEGSLAGHFSFTGARCECAEAGISLEALGVNPKKAWKAEISDSVRLCDEKTCRVDFAFEPPERLKRTTEFRLSLCLKVGDDRTETYEWMILRASKN